MLKRLHNALRAAVFVWRCGKDFDLTELIGCYVAMRIQDAIQAAYAKASYNNDIGTGKPCA